MFNYYGKLSAQVYDITKPVGHSINGDIEYYLKRIENCKGKVLEAGVGSGRFLIPLVEAGFDVDGVDISQAMLSKCKQNCDLYGIKANLYKADLSNFNIDEKYEAILIPTGSFCLITDRNQAIEALQNFYNHLKPDGKLILDLEYPHGWKTDSTNIISIPISDTSAITLENRSISIDYMNQITTSYLKYEKWEKGQLMETELQEFSLRWYGLEEFKTILEAIGFRKITITSNYNLKDHNFNDSKIITFEAIK